MVARLLWAEPGSARGAGGSEPGLAQRSEFTRAKARERKFREPQEGEQSGETLKEIKNRISRCSADGSAPALSRAGERPRCGRKRAGSGAAVGIYSSESERKEIPGTARGRAKRGNFERDKK